MLSVAGVMVSIVAFQAVDPGSIPGPRNVFLFFSWGGVVFLCGGGWQKKRTTSQRFELWRAEPNRFLIYLLNHSDTMSELVIESKCDTVSEWLRSWF
jgi:hypothetical protein